MKKSILFYGTWEEASASCFILRIKSYEDYQKKYFLDKKLPSNPNQVYKDFPGWNIFLRNEFYKTWQEAGVASRKLGITDQKTYRERYFRDKKLPRNPDIYYKDKGFPGLKVFLSCEIDLDSKKRTRQKPRKKFYLKWEEASVASIILGINSKEEYKENYWKNSLLPADPYKQYKNFPGWIEFLKIEKKDFYATWQEAGSASRKLGIKSSSDYVRKYMRDVKLPSNPSKFYKDFPSWFKFLQKTIKKKNIYPTWQEAGSASRKLGIMTPKEYRLKYKLDPLLPSNPARDYSDFPNWIKFLRDETKKTFYLMDEASEVVRKMVIKNHKEYKKKYKLDSRLPADPYKQYKNFPGWKIFLGTSKLLDNKKLSMQYEKSPKDLSRKSEKCYCVPSSNLLGEKIDDNKSSKKIQECYSTWKESIWSCLKIGIYDLISYRELRHKDPKLRPNPQSYYFDFKWGEGMFSLSYEEQEYFRKRDTNLTQIKELEIAI